MKTIRFFTALVLSAIFLSGCAGSDGKTESALIPDTQVKIPDIKVLNLYYQGVPAQEWADYMSQKYGVTIRLFQVQRDAAAGQIEAGALQGMVSLSDPAAIARLARAGKILPLDDLLADSPVWKAMPEGFRSQYQVDGKTYGIPAQYYREAMTRSYNTTWLEAVGTKVPSTLEELQTACAALSAANLDGDGIAANNCMIADTFPAPAMAGYKTMKTDGMCADLFAAYGIHINPTSANAVSYNPDSGQFEDGMAGPEAAEALRLLQKLYDNSWLSKDALWSGSSKSYASGSLLSTPLASQSILAYTYQFSGFFGPLVPTNPTAELAGFEPAAPLTGTHTENLMPCTYTNRCYVLTANTERPKETVNFFLDMTFGSVNAFLDCYLGSPEYFDYDRANGAVILKDLSPINLVSPVEGVYDPSQFLLFRDRPDTETLRKAREMLQKADRCTSDNLKNGKFYPLTAMQTKPVSNLYNKKVDDINTAFYRLIYEALVYKTDSVEALLKDYNTGMKELGIDQILQEANLFLQTNSMD